MKKPKVTAFFLGRRLRKITLGRLIDDFLVLASGQLISKVFGFLAFAWLARVLSSEDYGAVETAVGMAAIGTIALEMGTGAIGVRRIAQNGADPAVVLGAVVSGRTALAIIVAPCLAISYIALTNDHTPQSLFWLYAAALLAAPFNHNWFFQANEKMGVAGFGQTLKMAVFLAAAYLFRPQDNGVTYVAVAELISAICVAVWFSVFGYYSIRPTRVRYDFDAGIRLLKESGPLGASSFVNALAQYLPILVVASTSSSGETAEFGAAQRLVLSLMTFSYVYYFNLFPLIARRLVDNPVELGRLISASVRVTAWVGVIAASLLMTFSSTVMKVIFGPNFEDSGQEFGILVWSAVVILVSGNARWLLVAGKRQGALLAAQVVNAICVVVAGLFLSPILGGVGAAAACAVGAVGLWGVAHSSTLGLDVRPDLTGNILPALAALLVMLALTLTNFGRMTDGAIVLMLIGGCMALDRKLPRAVKTMIHAKSAT